LNIALFADVHGRIALCFDLCARWQQETGEQIDLILEAGDLAAFPDMSRIDSATLRYAGRDRTELGFMDHFATYREDIAGMLAQTSAPLIFVRGNHEDHEWLDSLENASRDPIFPIDAYNRVYCLKTGIPYRFERGSESITIVGIGRIAQSSRPRSSSGARIQDYEIRQLERHSHERADLLLTHDCAYGFVEKHDDSGMPQIRAYLDRHQPTYHIFGHIGHVQVRDVDQNGVTIQCKPADLHWTRSGTLEPGSFAVLRWHNRDDHHIEVIDEPWLAEYARYVWPFAR
jgi:Icc-related predicted phosphoesterase